MLCAHMHEKVYLVILHHCAKDVTHLLILFVYFFNLLALKNISKYLFTRALVNTLMQKWKFY